MERPKNFMVNGMTSSLHILTMRKLFYGVYYVPLDCSTTCVTLGYGRETNTTR